MDQRNNVSATSAHENQVQQEIEESDVKTSDHICGLNLEIGSETNGNKTHFSTIPVTENAECKTLEGNIGDEKDCDVHRYEDEIDSDETSVSAERFKCDKLSSTAEIMEKIHSEDTLSQSLKLNPPKEETKIKVEDIVNSQTNSYKSHDLKLHPTRDDSKTTSQETIDSQKIGNEYLEGASADVKDKKSEIVKREEKDIVNKFEHIKRGTKLKEFAAKTKRDIDAIREELRLFEEDPTLHDRIYRLQTDQTVSTTESECCACFDPKVQKRFSQLLSDDMKTDEDLKQGDSEMLREKRRSSFSKQTKKAVVQIDPEMTKVGFPKQGTSELKEGTDTDKTNDKTSESELDRPDSPIPSERSQSVSEAETRFYDLLRRMETHMGDPWEILMGGIGEEDLWDVPDSFNTSKKANYPQGHEMIGECLICFDHTLVRKRLCCNFPVCNECIELYLETQVNQGIVKIPCISGVCSSHIFRDEILGRLPDSMKDKYYRFLVEANKDPKVKTCPRCSHIYNEDELGSKNKAKFGVLVSCPECHLDWCFDCHAPWHQQVKCKDFKKGGKLLKTWAKEQHFGHNNAQRCPKCKIYIERKGGCDHMVCSRCNTNFCYRCGDRFCDVKFFGNHLSHLSKFSPLGCKYNFKPDQPFIRRSVRGSLFGAKLLGGVALLGVGIAAAGVLIGMSVFILPAFGGYKYNKHRKMKRRIKRQQELFKMRTKNAMLEMYRERDQLGFDGHLDFALCKPVSPPVNNSDTVHIGIQTGQSQQVDVTVHNPYHPDNNPDTTSAVEKSHNSQIRMNIKDDRGTVTVTTAEITHNASASNGSEAEIVLHVKTTYSNSDTEKPSIDY